MRKEIKIILLNRFTTIAKLAIGLVICLFISLQTGYAQEVDKNKSNKKKLRETKFKTRNKQGDRIHKGDITGRKTKIKKTKRKNRITSPSSTPYGNALYQYKNRRKEGKQVQKSDGYYNTPSRAAENHRKGDISGTKVRKSVTRTGESKRVVQAGGLRSITQGGEDKPRKRRRIQPRTASRAFIARKKVNVYAGRGRRGERARTKDIAGRKIRGKNFRSRSQPIVRPSFNPYFARKRKGDQAHTTLKGSGYATATKRGERKYKGQASGGYATATKRGERRYKGQAAGGYSSATKGGENAWRKDITGRKFKRPRDPGITTGRKGQTYTGTQNRTLSISGGIKNNGRKSVTSTGGGGSISGQLRKGRGQALPRKDLSSPQVSGFAGRYKRFELSPGFDSRSAKFQGNKKGVRKPLKGGGSISSNIWQGKGKALPRKDLGSPKVSGFAGNIKGTRKPLKGGGSISNQIQRGRGQALPRKDLSSPKVSGFAGRYKRFELSPGFDNRSAKFQGNKKGARKPLKGGGSISSNIWQGKGQAIPRKDLGRPKISGFAGNIKGNRKPLKGGGSITKSGWNNNQQALPRNDNFRNKMTLSQGNFKGSRKPLKGGGSISRSGWNNKQVPLIHKHSQNKTIANFKGRYKRFELSPGYATSDIGKYQGNIKRHKSKKIGQPEGTQFEGRFTQFEISPGYATGDIGKYRGTLKMKSKYKKKPNAHEDALKAKEPHKNMYLMSGYQGTVKDRRNFRKKPNAHEDALKGIAPKNSASKAMAYQGNFKVKKNYNRNMHPSSKYTTSIHPRNSKEEKERTFKFNIWWAKLFKKNENQPDAVKEKIRTPRYDKREKDLWYD